MNKKAKISSHEKKNYRIKNPMVINQKDTRRQQQYRKHRMLISRDLLQSQNYLKQKQQMHHHLGYLIVDKLSLKGIGKKILLNKTRISRRPKKAS